MARFLYSLLLCLGAPLILLRLLWRSRRQAGYRRHLGERLGLHAPLVGRPTLWLHAVSVGEMRAAQPLVEALRVRYPQHRLLLTCMTPTGRETGEALYGGIATIAYAPYDFPGAAMRFLERCRPQLGVLMETEIWPNLIAAAQRQQVPLVLANARLSEKSARGYRRFAALTRPAIAALDALAVQSAADGARLADLGAQRIEICGNLKFEVTPDPEKLELGRAWRAAIGARRVWLAASTRDGEEALILDALARLGDPTILLLLVPRHPQRFAEVADLVAARRLSLQRRSAGLPGATTQVWLGDSMGEMPTYYACADLCVIGGSLLPFGSQNLIEAAACGCPVLVGPSDFNFARATADALAAGAARRIGNSPEEIAAAVTAVLADAAGRTAMQRAAADFAAAHRGATERTLAVISAALERTPRRAAR